MAKCNQLTPLPFKGLIASRLHFRNSLAYLMMKLHTFHHVVDIADVFFVFQVKSFIGNDLLAHLYSSTDQVCASWAACM